MKYPTFEMSQDVLTQSLNPFEYYFLSLMVDLIADMTIITQYAPAGFKKASLEDIERLISLKSVVK